ncbi:MAG: TIGR04211 family SH3 domain-containing protein [Porticoccaceae bacterium]|nr:TIGR04211 family SH3 domain-containing protein [Porticoccaceae bacterium]MDG1474727.1 TIGR04211 family SH3 domain-containing protein [Porticoccaceae bacterium]
MKTHSVIMLLALAAGNGLLAQDNDSAEQAVQTNEFIDPPDIKEIVAPTAATENQKTSFKPVTKYVSDEFFVPLRETPCPRCKIVHWGIKSGTKVELTDLRNGWGLISTAKGYKGWMEEQFIVSSPAGKQLLAASKIKLSDASNTIEALQETISELRIQLEEMRSKNSLLAMDKQKIEKQLTEVEGISADPVALNQQNQTLVKQNHILQNDNNVLQAEVEILENDQRNQFFLYGALTLFLSALLVVLIPKLKTRKRLSEWG